MSMLDHLDNYCERLSPDFWAEPLNAITNMAFIIAAIMAARLLRKTYPECNDVPRDLAVLPTILLVMGIGSFLFHTFATRWAELADVLPILVFQLAAIAVLVRRIIEPNWCKVGAAWAVFLASGWLIGFLLKNVNTYGSSGYFAAWLVLVIAAFYLWKRQPKAARYFALAGSIFTVSLVLRTVDLPLCETLPLGTHFLWHCLNAVVLYKVFKGCLRLKREA